MENNRRRFLKHTVSLLSGASLASQNGLKFLAILSAFKPDISRAQFSDPVFWKYKGYGLFGGGTTTGANYFSNVQKYVFHQNVVSAGTALTVAKYGVGAAGNYQVGVFIGGDASAGVTWSSDVYNYFTGTKSAGGNLSSKRMYVVGVGNATTGYFGGGTTGSVVATMDKYTYSTNAAAAGTSLSQAEYTVSAAGVATFGMFMGGANSGSSAIANTYKSHILWRHDRKRNQSY